MASTRLRSVLFRAVPTLVVVGVFLLGFLGAPEDNAWLNRSHLWGPGDPFYTDSDERFVGSPTLIWRGRPSYRGTTEYEAGGVVNQVVHNRHGLRDDEIGKKAEGTLRVINVGDSATWGLNLRSRGESYSDQLEELLAREGGKSEPGGGPPRRYEVINGGTVGYSSLQALQYLRQSIEELEPDIATVYIGNNDPAPARMRDSDRIAGSFSRLRAVLGRNFFYLLLQKGILALRSSRADRAWDRFMDTMNTREDAGAFRSAAEYYRTLARVAPDRYEESLREMVRLCREKGVRLILLKVPMNLLWPLSGQPTPDKALASERFWCPVVIEPGYLARAQAGEAPGARPLADHPYLSLVTMGALSERSARTGESPLALVSSLLAAKSDGSRSDRDRIRATHNLGVWNLIQGDTEEAALLLESAAEWCSRCDVCPIPPDVGQVDYVLGIARFLAGDREGACEDLLSARAVFPFAMCPDYEARFDRVVAETGVEWIDLPGVFRAADPDRFGSALFHDWVHPNAEGSRLIAEAIAERLLDRSIREAAGFRPFSPGTAEIGGKPPTEDTQAQLEH